MTSLPNIPFLQFDFSSEKNSRNSIVFSNPTDVIWTNSFSEVSDCLKKVQQAVDLGFYAAGYLSYEAAYAWRKRNKIYRDVTMPLLWFGLFESPKSPFSHKEESFSVSDWTFNQTKDEYSQSFNLIQQAIERGETDQINYTGHFQTPFSGCAYTFYNQLKSAQQANYCAYMDLENIQVLSASPELFFQVKNGKLIARPMKGTVHRGKTWKDDAINRQWLAASEKNKLENDLITELMIEEFKKVVEQPSIKVVDQHNVEKYPTVYQMTSTIQGDIQEKVSIIDILTTLFPCGSITGVPKQVAIDLIADLEKSPRGVYCGAIGYITPNNEAVFNVPIRTVVIDKKKHLASYGAGGGITANSNMEEEFNEVLTKAKVLHYKQETFSLLETIGLINGQYLVFDEHLKRLKSSAAYFDFPIDLQSIKHELICVKNKCKTGKWRVRLVVDREGDFQIEPQRLVSPMNHNVILAKKPIDSENVFHYHKTTNRTIYERFSKEDNCTYDVLLWNKNDEVTEFTTGNIVVEQEGELITPPVACGLLPGTYRERLIKKGIIKVRKILINDLHSCSKIWLINSVREWVPVQLFRNNIT
ncbi:bifunctional chorismate-binding protein/class IV aminotransferase [Pseudogracilibacillus sp. SE30717A]|uniref:bifunctional chorismate-binding protein/class IV aminotransferase n=1 Tax=Pseudogracilibacillus sp. SE30717A TaxID=3098293 RepID=UPI00300E6D40